MIGLGAALILGGASLLGNLISSAADEAHSRYSREDTQEFNAAEAEKQRAFEAEQALQAREFSSAEAVKQREFEKMMSDTSYQRQRADLEAAGYNPASIGMTQGASTPQGATGMVTSARGVAASAGPSSVPSMSMGSYFSNLMSSAIAYKMSQDKNFTNKAIAEMYNTNASQMNQMTNATKKALAQMRKTTIITPGAYGNKVISEIPGK